MPDDLKFSAPDIDARALRYIGESLSAGHLSGDGPFTLRCSEWLSRRLEKTVLLAPSGTAALELAALLARLGPGDEVIMPSFTFSSTANAVVLRGATPVFVDIRPDTLNMNEALLECAITPRTKAIIPVHYAGVACEMDSITAIARQHDLLVIEDAAQGLLAYYRDSPLGTIGQLGCFSFHATKNIVSGEGGALSINGADTLERAQILREKGTNREAFQRGEARKYEWLDVGSSYLMSDILAALLLSQLERVEDIIARRLSLWNRYHAGLEDAERSGMVRRPAPPTYARHNGHIYFIVVPDASRAERLRHHMGNKGIPCPFHFVPLHSSPAGQKFGVVSGPMTVTDHASSALLRLPLHSGMTTADADRVLETLKQALKREYS